MAPSKARAAWLCTVNDTFCPFRTEATATSGMVSSIRRGSTRMTVATRDPFFT